MKVTIYTTKTCKYCKEAKEFFSANGVEYTEIDVGTDPKKREALIKKTGQLTVPVIVIGNKGHMGFEKEKIAKLLDIKL